MSIERASGYKANPPPKNDMCAKVIFKGQYASGRNTGLNAVAGGSQGTHKKMLLARLTKTLDAGSEINNHFTINSYVNNGFRLEKVSTPVAEARRFMMAAFTIGTEELKPTRRQHRQGLH